MEKNCTEEGMQVVKQSHGILASEVDLPLTGAQCIYSTKLHGFSRCESE